MVGKDAHLARLGGDVDLDDVLGPVDGLECANKPISSLNSPPRVSSLSCLAGQAMGGTIARISQRRDGVPGGGATG